MANSFTDQAAGPKNLQRPFGSSMLGRRTRSGTFKHGLPQDQADIEGAIDACKIKIVSPCAKQRTRPGGGRGIMP
jgi:hypothetical protein